MSIPTFDQFISPLLRLLAAHPDGLRSGAAYSALAEALELDVADQQALLPSGRQRVYQNRIGWAMDRLKRAGLARSARRGVWILTPAGVARADSSPGGLGADEVALIARSDTQSHGAKPPPSVPETELTPYERIDAAIEEVHQSVASELLAQIGAATPQFFEGLVLDLLHALGYGVSRDGSHPNRRLGGRRH